MKWRRRSCDASLTNTSRPPLPNWAALRRAITCATRGSADTAAAGLGWSGCEDAFTWCRRCGRIPCGAVGQRRCRKPTRVTSSGQCVMEGWRAGNEQLGEQKLADHSSETPRARRGRRNSIRHLSMGTVYVLYISAVPCHTEFRRSRARCAVLEKFIPTTAIL